MKINKIANTLHKVHHRCKNAYLVVFGLSILLITVLSQQVSAEAVVGSIQTKITYIANEKTVSFVTTENTLENALDTHGVTLEKNDITDPPLSTKLIGEDVSARLVPASPVLIDDNGQSWVGKSAYSQLSDILGQLNIEIDKADVVTIDLILSPELDNMAGQKITIKRAPVYTVSVDGKELLVHTWSKTVAEVLSDGGVSLNLNDTVVPSKDAIAPTTGQIEVTRVNYADFDEVVAIPFQNLSQTSYEMYKGQTKVTQQGVDGSKKQSVHVVYHNGVEVSREVMASNVLSQPQSKITLTGVKPYNAGMWWDTIVAAGQKYGVDPVAMNKVMICESGGNPFSGTSHKGLFQYSPDTWAGASAAAGYGGSLITDGTAQIYVTAWKVNHDKGWYAWGCKP